MSIIHEENAMVKRDERAFETASSAVAAQAKAMIEARYIMALRNPRNWDQVRQDLIKECRRPSFAHNKSALYRKPIGKDGVEGLGIRFVEVALRCMKNVLVESVMVYSDDAKEIHRVIVTDLETNTTWPMDVTVTKTVERSKPLDDGTYISVRRNSYGKNVYTIPAQDDELLNKRLALISKAIRTAALRIIPGDLQDEAEEIIRAIRLDAAAKDPDAERKKLADAFAAIGVKAADLTEYLGHSLDSCSPAEIVDLRGLYGAIKDGETTWLAVIENRREQTGTAAKSNGDEPRRKSEKSESPAPVADAPKTDVVPPANDWNASRPYRVTNVIAATKKSGPFTVEATDADGATYTLTCADQRLYIAAQSAKQSNAQVLINATRDGEDLVLVAIEEAN